jgi:hypothetical protein
MGTHHNRRRERRIQEAAEAIARGERPGGDDICAVCGRRLYGELAMSRGVGWQCWGKIQLALMGMGCAGRPIAGLALVQAELQL